MSSSWSARATIGFWKWFSSSRNGLCRDIFLFTTGRLLLLIFRNSLHASSKLAKFEVRYNGWTCIIIIKYTSSTILSNFKFCDFRWRKHGMNFEKNKRLPVVDRKMSLHKPFLELLNHFQKPIVALADQELDKLSFCHTHWSLIALTVCFRHVLMISSSEHWLREQLRGNRSPSPTRPPAVFSTSFAWRMKKKPRVGYFLSHSSRSVSFSFSLNLFSFISANPHVPGFCQSKISISQSQFFSSFLPSNLSLSPSHSLSLSPFTLSP